MMTNRRERNVQRFYWSPLVLFFLCITYWSTCNAADLIVIDGGAASPDSQYLGVAAEYYGVDVKSAAVSTDREVQNALELMKGIHVSGVVIRADLLPKFTAPRIFAALSRGRGTQAVPLLINGIGAGTAAKLLQDWSGGDIRECIAAEPVMANSLVLGAEKSLLHELADVSIPLEVSPACVFTRTDGARSDVLASYGATLPTLVRIRNGPQELFFASDSAKTGPFAPANMGAFFRGFSVLIPSLTFVRYAAGEAAWHAPGHYGNFSLDDVWLTQPYGHLDFKTLLDEMEKHNFHTTLGFIPWNFDRNEPEAIDLVKQHPKRYSIAIHGDNHDHEEFVERTGDKQFTPLPEGQMAFKMKQAIARMERFQTSTGIPYDRFMIFPHEVFPALGLKVLKRYNYIGVVSESRTPDDRARLKEPGFFMRLATTSFENFPSLRRYSTEVKIADYVIPISLYLEQPMLFYAHHTYFKQGITAFDSTADMVNRIDPGIHWTGLGTVGEHLYRLRLRADGDVDVFTQTADLRLANESDCDITYHVVKDETFAEPIRQVSANGQAMMYEREGNTLKFVVNVPANQESHVQIEYANDLDIATVDVSKPNWRINSLRRISDFRDLTLAKWPLGDRIVSYYYDNIYRSSWTVYQTLAAAGLAVMALILAIFLRQRHIIRRKHRGIVAAAKITS